jgi:hypothetical protein
LRLWLKKKIRLRWQFRWIRHQLQRLRLQLLRRKKLQLRWRFHLFHRLRQQ